MANIPCQSREAGVASEMLTLVPGTLIPTWQNGMSRASASSVFNSFQELDGVAPRHGPASFFNTWQRLRTEDPREATLITVWHLISRGALVRLLQQGVNGSAKRCHCELTMPLPTRVTPALDGQLKVRYFVTHNIVQVNWFWPLSRPGDMAKS
jgi:hypothetical protein